MDEIEQRGYKEERELNRLGDSGQEGSQRCRDQDTGCYFGNACLTDHSQGGRWQSKHHDGEEPCHEISGRGITCEVACQVAMHDALWPMICAKLEPDKEVEHMVQTNRDKQTVQRPVYASAQRSK